MFSSHFIKLSSSQGFAAKNCQWAIALSFLLFLPSVWNVLNQTLAASFIVFPDGVVRFGEKLGLAVGAYAGLCMFLAMAPSDQEQKAENDRGNGFD